MRKDGTHCLINYPLNMHHNSTNNKYCDKSKRKNYSKNLESKRSSEGSLIDALMSHQMYF
jgi:hypothetical protein